jgi:hypothetical protein
VTVVAKKGARKRRTCTRFVRRSRRWSSPASLSAPPHRRSPPSKR